MAACMCVGRSSLRRWHVPWTTTITIRASDRVDQAFRHAAPRPRRNWLSLRERAFIHAPGGRHQSRKVPRAACTTKSIDLGRCAWQVRAGARLGRPRPPRSLELQPNLLEFVPMPQRVDPQGRRLPIKLQAAPLNGELCRSPWSKSIATRNHLAHTWAGENAQAACRLTPELH